MSLSVSAIFSVYFHLYIISVCIHFEICMYLIVCPGLYIFFTVCLYLYVSVNFIYGDIKTIISYCLTKALYEYWQQSTRCSDKWYSQEKGQTKNIEQTQAANWISTLKCLYVWFRKTEPCVWNPSTRVADSTSEQTNKKISGRMIIRF